MSSIDELYTNPANTPPVYNGVIKKVEKNVKAVKTIKHSQDDYIKKHIEVIAPVQYTDQLPIETTIIVYAMMGLVLFSLLWDGYCVVKHSYCGIKNLLTG